MEKCLICSWLSELHFYLYLLSDFFPALPNDGRVNSEHSLPAHSSTLSTRPPPCSSPHSVYNHLCIGFSNDTPNYCRGEVRTFPEEKLTSCCFGSEMVNSAY